MHFVGHCFCGGVDLAKPSASSMTWKRLYAFRIPAQAERSHQKPKACGASDKHHLVLIFGSDVHHKYDDCCANNAGAKHMSSSALQTCLPKPSASEPLFSLEFFRSEASCPRRMLFTKDIQGRNGLAQPTSTAGDGNNA